MTLRPAMPRLLPMTIAALALLLGMKSAAIVRAAVPAAPEAAAKPPAASPAPAPPTAVPPAKPAAAPVAAAPPPADPSPPADPPVSEAERALLLDLRQRKQELDSFQAALALRESVIAAAEKRLAARADELVGLQKQLEGLEAARRARDEANWGGLVKLYEGMKPRDAANIFNDLDAAVLLQVLDRMKESKAAPILAAMQPERARLVTTQLAQMRARTNAAPGARNGT